MLANQGQAGVIANILSPVSAAATANATSGWIDVRAYEGDIVITQHIGAMTGIIVGALDDATDASGSNAAGITPNEGGFSTVNTSNNIQKRTINANAVRGWIRYTGTIATGPVLTAVSLMAHPKYTT